MLAVKKCSCKWTIIRATCWKRSCSLWSLCRLQLNFVIFPPFSFLNEHYLALDSKYLQILFFDNILCNIVFIILYNILLPRWQWRWQPPHPLWRWRWTCALKPLPLFGKWLSFDKTLLEEWVYLVKLYSVSEYLLKNFIQWGTVFCNVIFVSEINSPFSTW